MYRISERHGWFADFCFASADLRADGSRIYVHSGTGTLKDLNGKEKESVRIVWQSKDLFPV